MVQDHKLWHWFLIAVDPSLMHKYMRAFISSVRSEISSRRVFRKRSFNTFCTHSDDTTQQSRHPKAKGLIS